MLSKFWPWSEWMTVGGLNRENNLDTRMLATVVAFWSLVANASHYLVKWSITTRTSIAGRSLLQWAHIIKSPKHKWFAYPYWLQWRIALMRLILTLTTINTFLMKSIIEVRICGQKKRSLALLMVRVIPI